MIQFEWREKMENIITQEDMDFLAEQSTGNLNMILAGMTTIMEENQNMVSLMENQNWFQRMAKTISGKNKMTQNEIAQNHDKINIYISQAMGELYNRNCIDHEIILGLGNKINELYETQIEIKMIIGAFAQKLNQKIESIDNFHMLIEEVNQNVYGAESAFFSISKIMSQLDIRTVKDQRKMDILIRALEEHNIINHEEVLFSQMLEDLLELNENDAGMLAIFFGNIRSEYIAEITEKTIYSYYMLPEKVRKMKNKHSVVESILNANDISLDYSISSYDMCTTLIEAYTDNIIEAAIEDQKDEEEEKKQKVQSYVNNAVNLLNLLKNMAKTWNADNGEMNTYQSRKRYSEFMLNLIDNLNKNSYIGSSIILNLNNITFFTQNLFLKYPDLKVTDNNENLKKYMETDEDIHQRVNANVALEIDEMNEEFDTVKKFKTVTEYFSERITNVLNDREKFEVKHMDELVDEFPDIMEYTVFDANFIYMQFYTALFKSVFENVLNKIEDLQFTNDIYNLIQRFPIEYCMEDYENTVIRNLDVERAQPHIELEYTSLFGTKQSSMGYANIGMLDEFETKTVLLKFKNMKLKNYTANYEIIENSYVDTDTWQTCEYADVEWGKWVDNNSLELKITKWTSENFGSFKMKVKVEEDPNVIAFIESV